MRVEISPLYISYSTELNTSESAHIELVQAFSASCINAKVLLEITHSLQFERFFEKIVPTVFIYAWNRHSVIIVYTLHKYFIDCEERFSFSGGRLIALSMGLSAVNVW